MTKIKVAVLYGGISSERAVSIKSGENVINSLPRDKYSVSGIEITAGGKWLLNGKSILLFNTQRGAAGSPLKKFDVVFIALHGEFGEDGKVQAILDFLKVPYTGSGMFASAVGMNKLRTMEIAKKIAEIPRTAVFHKIPAKADMKAFYGNVREAIGYPCVVKPNGSGSSIGIKIAHGSEGLLNAMKNAFKENRTVLIQQYVEGRELTCGILGNANEELLAFPPVEIIPPGEFFDYESKYSPRTKEICPPDIPPKTTREIQEMSKQIHNVIGCDGLTRSDFILSPGGTLFFLEINTIPGLTAESLCPKEAKAAGMSLPEFMDKQVELALKKFGKK